jgi:ribose-phosphate pyrophosphokinase
MDLHAPQVHGFFSVPVDHLTAIPIITDYIRTRYDLDNSVVVAADAGGAKRAGRIASRLKLPMAIIDKRRVGDQNVHQGFVVGEVKGKNAIVFEDEIATGSTMSTTFQTLDEAGVEQIVAGASHPVLCGPAIHNLQNSAVQQIIVTNTCHVGPEKQFDKLTVLSVAPLMAEAIRRIHTGESVGALFT